MGIIKSVNKNNTTPQGGDTMSDKDKEKEKEKRREEILKSYKFAEKYLSGLTKEHFETKFKEAVEGGKDDLFIWEFLFKNQEKLKKMKKEEQELFIWEFLFKKQGKRK